MKKRILAAILSSVLIIALVGCGGRKRQPIELTLNTEDAVAILAAAGIDLPDAETAKGAGSTVNWYAWYDPFQNYSADEIVNTGFFTFKEKYAGVLNHVECTWDERFTKLATLVLSNEAPDAYPGDTEVFPYYAVGRKMFAPVDDYIDYNDAMWSGVKNIADNYFSIAGKHYIMITNLDINYVVGYNRRVVVDEWGFDDPAELFYNNQWTSDVWLEMCKDFTDPDEDRYAVDGWYYDVALMYMAGEPIVSYNPESGLFESNLDNPKFEKAADVVLEMKRNDTIFPVWQNGWKLRGGEEIQGIGVKDGLTLFFVTGLWGLTDTVESMSTRWGDVTNEEVMFVPMPRFPDDDYYYATKLGGLCIVRGSTNPDGVALLAMCMRFQTLNPTVMSVDRMQKMNTYLWTDEMLDMYDFILDVSEGDHSFVDYEAGIGPELYSTELNFINLGRSANETTWAQVKEAYGDVLQYQVDQFNEEVAQYLDDDTV